MDRSTWNLAPGKDRRAELGQERETPEHIRPRSRNCQRHEPDDVRGSKRKEKRRREGTRLGHVAARSLVEHKQHRAHADVREREPDRGAPEDPRHRGRGGSRKRESALIYRLLAAKLWLALLDERGQSLVRVLGRTGKVERAPLEVDASRQRRLERLVDGFLRQAHRDGALGG